VHLEGSVADNTVDPPYKAGLRDTFDARVISYPNFI
jgi:hypothetical protein